jgi:hypothetical protein
VMGLAVVVVVLGCNSIEQLLQPVHGFDRFNSTARGLSVCG